MTRGSQVEIGGLRVDRPMWSDDDRAGATPDAGNRPPNDDEGRRLPAVHRYGVPVAPRRRPAVDVDLTVPASAPTRPPTVDRPLGRIDHRRPAPVTTATNGVSAPETARRPVDIDLTVPLAAGPPATTAPAHARRPTPAPARPPTPAPTTAPSIPSVPARAPRPAVAPLTHTGAPPGTTTASEGAAPAVARHEFARWVAHRLGRQLRRLRRRFRPPAASASLSRTTVGLVLASAVLVVASAVASTAHGTLQERHEFLDVTVPLHRDPAVAADLSEQVAAQLEDDGGVPAGASTEVAPLIEQMIRSEEFGPVWRSALLRAHDDAANGGSASGDVVGEALPGLGARLAQEGALASPDFEERPVQLVPAAYVAELRRVIDLASRAAKVLPLAAVVLAGFALYRSRNRMRAGALLGVATAVVAAVTVVAVAPLSDLVVSQAVAEPVQPFAMAAAGGVGSTVRTIVVFVAMMAVLLAVAGRLEEVRSAPPFPVVNERHRSRRGGSRSWNPRRSYRSYRASRSYRSYRGSRYSRSYRHDATRRWSDRRV